MRRILMIAVVLLSTVLVKAQDNSNRIGVGLGGFTRRITTMRGSSSPRVP